jgi:hypothetical protein
LALCIEPCITSKADLPHSSSPDKKKKRSALGSAQLEPLRHEPKPIASLYDSSFAPLPAACDRMFLADFGREMTSAASIRCPTPSSLKGSQACEFSTNTCVTDTAMLAGGYVSNAEAVQGASLSQEQECKRVGMKRSESLPTLSHVNTAPVAAI